MVVEALILEGLHPLARVGLHPQDGRVECSSALELLEHLWAVCFQVVMNLPPEAVEAGQ